MRSLRLGSRATRFAALTQRLDSALAATDDAERVTRWAVAQARAELRSPSFRR
jgi:hypothetical protein